MTGRVVAAVVGCLFMAVGPAEAEEWETIAEGPVAIKSRQRPGTPIREVWAEGRMGVSVQDIQSVLTDTEAHPQFMPYLKESRFVGQPEEDGSRIVYGRVELPLVGAARDYVLNVVVEQEVAPDGSGVFMTHWVALPERLPRRANVIRLKVNEGRWEVTPLPEGGSHVTYRCTLDPGGWVPPFIANMGNRSGITDTFRAVEREARRRAAGRTQ